MYCARTAEPIERTEMVFGADSCVSMDAGEACALNEGS